MSERVAVVVVHHGDRTITERCLDSLRAVGADIVLVDNAEVAAPWPELGPGIEVIAPGRNIGYGAAANLGLRRAFEGAPFALLLNNDVVVVHPEFVDQLLARLEDDPTVGVAGPLVVYPDGRPQPTVENWPSLWRALRLILWRRSARVADDARVVEAVNGVCMLLRRDAFERTGGFDESYFMYGEEADLCWRAAEAGLRTLYVPVPSIVHEHEEGETRGAAAALVRLNYVRFCRDHRGVVSATLVGLLFLLASTIRRRGPVELARRLSAAFLTDEGTPHEDPLLVALDRIVVPFLLAFWIVLLALGSAFSIPLRDLGSTGKFGVLVVLVAVELPRIAVYRRRYLDQLRPGLPHMALSAFVLVAAASALWSPDPHYTLKLAGTFGLMAAALLLAPWRLAQTSQGARAIANSLLAGVAVVVLAGIAAFVVFPNEAWVTPPGSTTRFRGFLENPDELGAYFFIAPFALWRLRPALRGPRQTWPKGAIVAVLFLGELVASGGRGAIVFFAGVVALYLVGERFGARAALGTLAVLIVTLTAATFLVLSPSLAGITWPAFTRPSTLQNLGGRTQAWTAAGRLIDRRPLGGFGLGSEELMVTQFRDEGARLYQACVGVRGQFVATAAAVNSCNLDLPRKNRLGDFAGGLLHNSYLGLAVQLGGIVLGAAVALMAAALVTIGRAVRPGAALTGAAFAAAVGGAAWGLLSTYLWNPGNIVAGLFWLVLLVGVAQARGQRAEERLVATIAS